MQVKIHSSWQNVLTEEFEKNYFHSLISFVKNEYLSKKCFPKGSQIFSAFDHCPFDELKVVIIGQDPYPTRGHADGLGLAQGLHRARL